MSFSLSDIGELSLIKEITLDLDVPEHKNINAKKYDSKSRYLAIKVTNRNKDFLIPANTQARIRCTKPDNTISFADCSVLQNVIYVELSDQILSAKGMVKADIGLYLEKSILSTCTFYINVDSSFDENSVDSSNDFSALNNALISIHDAVELAEIASNLSSEAISKVNNLQNVYEYYSDLPSSASENTIAYVLNNSFDNNTNTSSFSFLNSNGNLRTDKFNCYLNPHPVVPQSILDQVPTDGTDDENQLHGNVLVNNEYYKLSTFMSVIRKTEYVFIHYDPINETYYAYYKHLSDNTATYDVEIECGDYTDSTGTVGTLYKTFSVPQGNWYALKGVPQQGSAQRANTWKYEMKKVDDINLPIFEDVVVFANNEVINTLIPALCLSSDPCITNIKKSGYYKFVNNNWIEYPYIDKMRELS